MTRLTRLMRTDVPIVLGPFGGASSVELAGVVADSGGLGSYGLYGYDRERIREVTAALRARTQGAIALNLWLPTGDEALPGDVDLEPGHGVGRLLDEMGAELSVPARFLPPFEEQLEAALEGRPAVLSLVYGAPALHVVEAAHAAGAAVIATATTVPEAVALEAAGVDAIVASGAEAAGHRVSFLHDPEDALVGTFALVPQVVDAVRVPVLAAGGIADRRGVAAAFALGAEGVVVGTAFLRTRQSAICASYRRAILGAAAHDSVLTTAMSGRLARGLRNRAMSVLEDEPILPFPAQNWLTGKFRAEAARRDQADLLSLWIGQAAPLAIMAEADDVFRELAHGVPS
ncbi:NAD(P)H-dependent flavin oxidoreductase [Demequina sp.]|uniref:NAD(P)H-dependent flavin oxidoreductase n=1 Tax=Demequina sp. TaxID=2050685 RepID=UPI003D0FDDE9